MSDFAKKFLQARDGSFSPYDSWKQKKNSGMPRLIELHFAHKLESLDESDWEDILIVAAKSGARGAVLNFRYACDMETANELTRIYTDSYVIPHAKSSVLGMSAAAIQDPIKGWFFIGLFSTSHTPPEDRDPMSHDQVRELFNELGFIEEESKSFPRQ